MKLFYYIAISLFLIWLGGTLLGAMTALYRNKWPDTVIMLAVILGISVPSFVFAAFSQLAIVKINGWFGISLLRSRDGARLPT